MITDQRVTAGMKSDSDRVIKDKKRREIRAEEEETCKERARGKSKVMFEFSQSDKWRNEGEELLREQ